MSHLAVIQTPSNPYHLVKEINGKYFEIEKIKNLSDALSLHMADFRKAYDAAGGTEVDLSLIHVRTLPISLRYWEGRTSSNRLIH